MLAKVGRYFFRLLIIFGYLFEMPIVSALTTRRLSALFAILIIITSGKYATIKNLLRTDLLRSSVLCFGFCFLLAIFHSIIYETIPGNSYFDPWHVIYIFLYVYIFSIYIICEFDSPVDFAKVFVGIMLIQSFIVYAAVLDYNTRIFLYDNFYFTETDFEKGIENGSRIVGLGLHSSNGSIVISSSCLMLLYLKIKNFIGDLSFIVPYLIIMTATAFIGRTGLYIEVATLVMYLVTVKGVKSKLLNVGIPVCVAVYLIGYLLSQIDDSVAEFLLEWMKGGLDKEQLSGTRDGIFDGIPNYSGEILFGTGVSSGKVPNGSVTYADSGYIRMYSALGIVGATAFYIGFLNLLKAPKERFFKGSFRIFFLFIFFILFAIEIKEPFMMQFILPWFILTLGLYETKEH